MSAMRELDARPPSRVGRALSVPVVALFAYGLFGSAAASFNAPPSALVPNARPTPAPAATASPAPVRRASPPPPRAPASAAPKVPAEIGTERGCAPGMARVTGAYCPEVDHTCERWLDPPEKPYARCAVYTPPARCKAPRVDLDFCIDRREYTPPGETLPQNHASLQITGRVCKSLGKRACNEREWNFACEGEEMRPYPYGWERSRVCNHDREDLYVPDPRKQVLVDHRWPSGSHADCVSPFGVYDLVGNLDEPVLKDPPGHVPFSNALKGGWWMPARNRCRPATTAHNDYFTGIQVGIRCCDDPTPE